MSQAPHHAQRQSTPVVAHTGVASESPGNEFSEDMTSVCTVKMSKVLSVEIKGTMAGFSAMGPNSATWKPVDGKQATIFGADDDMRSSAETSSGDLSSIINSLQNATITKVKTNSPIYNQFINNHE